MKRLVPFVLAAAVLCGGVLFVRGLDRYAYAQGVASAPELDAGPAAAPAVTVTAPATSDIAISPQAPAPTEPTAAAAAPASPERSADAVVDDVVKDVQAGNWRYAAAGVLSLLMILLRNQRQRVKLFAGKRGGAILVAILGLGATLVAVLMSSVQLTPNVLLGAAGATFTAVGGWHWFRDVITGDGVTSGETES